MRPVPEAPTQLPENERAAWRSTVARGPVGEGGCAPELTRAAGTEHSAYGVVGRMAG